MLLKFTYISLFISGTDKYSLFDEGRIAYSACNTKDSKGKAIFDALDSFVASGVDLLAQYVPSNIDFYIITGDRAKGPMKSVVDRLQDSRLIRRHNRTIFIHSTITIDPKTQVQETNDPFDIFFSTKKSDKPIQKLQKGLDELWEELKKKDDIIEDSPLKRSPQNYKKKCKRDYELKSIVFTVSL